MGVLTLTLNPEGLVVRLNIVWEMMTWIFSIRRLLCESRITRFTRFGKFSSASENGPRDTSQNATVKGFTITILKDLRFEFKLSWEMKIYFKFSSEMVQTLGRRIQETESKTGFSANFEPLFIRMAKNRGHSNKKGRWRLWRWKLLTSRRQIFLYLHATFDFAQDERTDLARLKNFFETIENLSIILLI